MYSIDWTEDAKADRLQIIDWYDTILSKLAHEFNEEVSYKVDMFIAKYPKIAQIAHKNARKLSLNRFPYNLVYTIDETKKEVQILAIVHDRRDPRVWKDRI